MALGTTLYNALLRRTSTFALTIAVGAFVFERAFDMGVDSFWRAHNKGKLWDDIKHKYEQPS